MLLRLHPEGCPLPSPRRPIANGITATRQLLLNVVSAMVALSIRFHCLYIAQRLCLVSTKRVNLLRPGCSFTFAVHVLMVLLHRLSKIVHENLVGSRTHSLAFNWRTSALCH
jgi:hypothetical protein